MKQGKSFTNREVAQLLKRVAAAYQIRGADFFRIRAYQNAAASIDTLNSSLYSLWQQDRLDDVPGVGANLLHHLDQLFRTGQVKHFQTEFKKVPQGMFALLSIRGIGPKMAYKIAKEFDLNDEKTALKKLKKLIKDNKLQDLPGFGPKLEEKINTSIKSKFTSKQKLLLPVALDIAQEYVDYLLSSPAITKAEPLGSLRRHADTVGDIDLAFTGPNQARAMAAALKFPRIQQKISAGQSVARVQLDNGHEIDLKFCPQDEWGSLLQHYTGSKLHNINLRTLAKNKDLSLSEHGIKDKKGKVTKFTTEKGFYRHLGLPWIPPEIRLGLDEIDLAKKDQLPHLIGVGDIKGDLHIHTNCPNFPTSHDMSQSSLSDILDQTRALGYSYIGLTDHNPKMSGLSLSGRRRALEKRKAYLLKEHRCYEKKVKTGVPKILIGLEIDIRPDGSLALEDELIDTLDYAIASIHSNHDLSPADNTQRLLKALSHPKVLIWGHPTGRMLNRRPGIEVDWPKLFKFCAKNNKYIEINSYPARLDLPVDLIKIALEEGAQFVINSDSHHADQFANINYGVWHARAAGLEKKHVLNTQSYSSLRHMLN